jgi:hypothetical protein
MKTEITALFENQELNDFALQEYTPPTPKYGIDVIRINIREPQPVATLIESQLPLVALLVALLCIYNSLQKYKNEIEAYSPIPFTGLVFILIATSYIATPALNTYFRDNGFPIFRRYQQPTINEEFLETYAFDAILKYLEKNHDLNLNALDLPQCPIGMMTITTPVNLGHETQIIELKMLQTWLARNNTNPLTNEALDPEFIRKAKEEPNTVIDHDKQAKISAVVLREWQNHVTATPQATA